MINLRPAALCGAMLLIAANSVAAGRSADDGSFRVLHYEPVTAPRLQEPARLAGQSIRFQALGRDFHLRLQDNNRLLDGLSENRRQEILQDTEILRGQLDQVPGSWVRLTRSAGEIRGLIWDGQEMFALGPGYEVALSSTTPTVIQTYGPVIFRWADTENLFTDIVRAHPRLEELNTERQLGLLNEELREKIMLHGSDHFRLDIAAVGDFEYTSVLGSFAESGLVDRINSVDGIFESQLGIQINLAELRVFDVAANDPFGTTFAATSDASQLIDDVADYKFGDSVLRPLSIVHLFTGVNLDMDTVGIAFRPGVCDARFGVSLTQAIGIGVPAPNYLVTAHEIGHNFNAPHDGDTTGACGGTSDNAFLMAPTFNGVDIFSTCSIQEIQAEMARVSCLTLLGPADPAVTIADPNVSALAGATFDYAVQIDNQGQTAASNVTLTLTVDAALALGNIRMPGFSCSAPVSPVVCQALELNTGGSATLTVAITGTTQGSFNVSAIVGSDNDDDLSNNMQSGTVGILPAADLAVSATMADAFIRSTDGTTVTISVVNNGPQTAINTQLLIDLGALLTVVPGQLNPACTTPDNQMLTCLLWSTLAPGAQQSIVQPVDAAGSIGAATVSATIGSDLPDSDMGNNDSDTTVQVASRLVDLRATVGTLPIGVEFGQSGSFSVSMENLGPDTASQPEVEIVAGGTGVSFSSVTADSGSCTFIQRVATCTATDLSGTQTVTVAFNALSAGDFTISATAHTTVAGESDTDSANDADSKTITLQDASTNTGGGGGGGGGGSPDLGLIGLLILLVARRHRPVQKLCA